MRESTRQAMLRSGAGITRRAFAALVASSAAKSWTGCQSGMDWCGVKVRFQGLTVSAVHHTVNGALTGYEQSGTSPAVAVAPAVGDKVEVHTRVCTGRSVDGDRFYGTTVKQLVVV